jgi:hypothetical protein
MGVPFPIHAAASWGAPVPSVSPFAGHFLLKKIASNRSLTRKALDYMIWNTGTIDDFDRLADVTDDEGWSWKHVRPLIKNVRMVAKVGSRGGANRFVL